MNTAVIGIDKNLERMNLRRIVRHEDSVKKQNISSFKDALQETMLMSADIAQNGIEGYKTLDDLLNEE
jgi:hypothetical protein